MLKRMAWVVVAFLFLATASFQLFVYIHLLLWQEVTYFEFNVAINLLEFAFSLMVAVVALFAFGYCGKRLLMVRS